MLFFNANMAEAEGFKEVILTKHDVFGFGFSVIGGSQYDLPPVISDILDGSPADLCNEVSVSLDFYLFKRIALSPGRELRATSSTQFTSIQSIRISKQLRLFLLSNRFFCTCLIISLSFVQPNSLFVIYTFIHHKGRKSTRTKIRYITVFCCFWAAGLTSERTRQIFQYLKIFF